jgi:hypothetical protein
MRLMVFDVEVPQPEREVDRIDVLERRREQREVNDEIDRGDRED